MVEDLPPMTVVSLGWRGSYSFQSYRQGVERLAGWLEQHPHYRAAGPPRRLFYDGPYLPDALKRSEVQIPIEPAQPAEG